MNDKEIIVRDVPYRVWVFGLVLTGVGIYAYFRSGMPVFVQWGLIAIGMLVVGLVPAVTVWIDRSRRILAIEKRSLMRHKSEQVEIDKIKHIFVDQRVSTDDEGDRSVTYRVVLVLEGGEQLPLRKSSSGGRRKKEIQAEAIREALGLERVGLPPESFGEALAMAAQLNQIENQEALTGIPPGEQETNGVHWQLETYQFGGAMDGSPVHRWSSTDFETPDYFVYVAQRMEGVGKQRGLMKLAGNKLFKLSLRMFGFDDYYTPGVDRAETIEDVDRRLVEDFFVHTSNPAEARRILNPWTVMPLIGWAERYALEKGAKQFHQLSVLFSPLGVYVSAFGELNAAQVDELVSLGVEIVRAQGG